eukprot:PLAT13249.1.p1 GENE.PLAT13249.1~~PLAT13249.1.p1  ORF type:complete len:293 (-),score=116.69 PLAT13249.1:74-928(-)
MNPAAMRKQLSKHRNAIFGWVGLVLALLMVYHLLSDGDFSFLMTISGTCRLFAFGCLLVKIHTQKSCAGVSLKSLECYALAIAARLCSILVYEGYLPYDKSGDWYYQTAEVLSLLMVLVNVFLTLRTYAATYKSSIDVFGNYFVPPAIGVIWLIGPALLLAVLAHPSLNQFWATDIAWTFGLYLECVAILPQLYLFVRKGGEVESFTSHFVFSLFLSRLFDFIFWLSSYSELNDKYSHSPGGRYVGLMVLFSQIVQLLLMGDFVYQYVRSMRRGVKMMLPTYTV